MNSNYYQMNNMAPRPIDDEDELRRRAVQSKSKRAVNTVSAPVRLAAQSDPWGKDGTCLGLKILCGALGLVIVVLIVVLVIKMVAHKGGQPGQTASSASSSQDSQLPMSIQGGFHFGDESLMSTSI